MSKRSTILKIAGLDPRDKRTHLCTGAGECHDPNCRHSHPHEVDEEECLIHDYCTELGSSCGGRKRRCVEV